jgi:membrane protease YdiL (CAAX protease family)
VISLWSLIPTLPMMGVPPPQTPEPSGLDAFLTATKPLFPIPALVVILPALYFFFRKTWRELDEEAQKHRGEMLARGEFDRRPFLALVICAIVLTMQEYYGGRGYFDDTIAPKLALFDAHHHHVLRYFKYNELWSFGWWVFARVAGYVLVPFPVFKLLFRKDSLLDLGLRTKGFFTHAWIYALFLAIVVPAMLVVSAQPDFGNYYPFYKLSQRSWFDFLTWEAIYFVQFFALEMFFRGFWLGVLRKSFGSGAIFAMAVPYCMIHYGKPYLEASGAIVAGIALGSLSMKTKSIYQGFLVHITVAGMMDWLALSHRNQLPHTFWPAEEPTHWVKDAVPPAPVVTEHGVKTVLVLFALTMIAIVVVTRWRALRLVAKKAPEDGAQA